jgi:hypothetical protein
MACFWCVWSERPIDGTRKSLSWSSAWSFWSRTPSRTVLFSAGCIAPKEPYGSSIGFFETLAMTLTCLIEIKSMKERS